ncbi:hypothetical protein [Phytohabitans kaempferiae]|uniref:Secreted protein n=1 Tax=Phytohabitans kaempferiae TaxID=1620943 RepID=A0ABV6M356_9ACTN
MRGTAVVGRVLAAALLAVLALTSVHGAASSVAPVGAMAQGPASIVAALVQAAPCVASCDQRLDLKSPVPGKALPRLADAERPTAAEPHVALPVAVTSAPHFSRAPPLLR